MSGHQCIARMCTVLVGAGLLNLNAVRGTKRESRAVCVCLAAVCDRSCWHRGVAHIPHTPATESPALCDGLCCGKLPARLLPLIENDAGFGTVGGGVSVYLCGKVTAAGVALRQCRMR